MNLLSYDLNTLIEMENSPTVLVINFIINTIIILLTFSLKAVAIQTMARKRGLQKLYLAWIPFFNYILLGKIVGETTIWGYRIKNLGKLVCILSLISYAVLGLLNLGYYVNNFEIVFNFKVEYSSTLLNNWMSSTGIPYTVINILHTIFSLVEIFAKATLIYYVFIAYAPERAFIYMIVSILIDPLFGPILFMIRNRDRATIRVYVRPEQYNNPYGDKYNNPYNSGYGQNNNSQNAQSIDDEPFPEFSNKTSGVDKTTENSSNDDDLFN